MFDLDKFYRNISQYLGFMLSMRHRNDHHGYYDDIYKLMAKNGISIPDSAINHYRRLELKFWMSYLKNKIGHFVDEYDLF